MKTARITGADARVLPDGRIGPMPWVLAIMMFLTVLAAAAGLGLSGAAGALEAGNRITIQIVEADATRREAEARAAMTSLRQLNGVEAVRRVELREVQQLLEPWLGAPGEGLGVPIPAMIEADLSPEGIKRLREVKTAIIRVAPSARVDANEQWLQPLHRLVSALRWLSASLVILMLVATAATVVLAARAALDTHRATIEILHLMGATDRQVARLFQRRIALDALFGGALGFAAAGVALLLLGARLQALGSELVGSISLSSAGWVLLALLPIGGVLLALLVARATILRAMVRLT